MSEHAERMIGILRAERDQARAQYDSAIKRIVGIHSLLYPAPVTTADGRTFVFRPKSPDPHEVLQELSDRIRALADVVPAPSMTGCAVDIDNGLRSYPWTYTNQPGNIGASVLGGCALRAKPGGDSIDHGLSLLRELHLQGLGIVRVPALAAPETKPKVSPSDTRWLCLLCKSSTPGRHGTLDDRVTPCPNGT